MIYLLDSNVLIRAKNQYYQMDRVPEFWEWLIYHGQESNIKIPKEIYKEFKDARKAGERDELAEWASKEEVEEALVLTRESESYDINYIVTKGYLVDYTEANLIKIGRDPFLISYALNDKKSFCVVTDENSASRRKGANRMIPDVCKQFNIGCWTIFDLLEKLDFRTDWKSHI